MSQTKFRVSVFFSDPFWTLLCERTQNGMLEVCKLTFGSQPKDEEVYRYLLNHWQQLRFSPPVSAAERPVDRVNPKRMQRLIARQMDAIGMSTKSQQAVKLQQSEGKAARKQRSRREREEEAARKFALKQDKRKQKHRGH